MSNVSVAQWTSIVDAAREVQEWFPNDIAFIGGVAAYFWTKSNADVAGFAALSHDVDLMITRASLADLRDLEIVTPNRRLSKYQFIKDDNEFDVYVEGEHSLSVPAEEVIAYSVLIDGLKLACVEHLLILKLDARNDRKRSAKGDKDEDDIARLLLIHPPSYFQLENNMPLLQRMGVERVEDLKEILDGDAFIRLTKGNSFIASKLKRQATSAVEAIDIAVRRIESGWTYGGGGNDESSCSP